MGDYFIMQAQVPEREIGALLSDFNSKELYNVGFWVITVSREISLCPPIGAHPDRKKLVHYNFPCINCS